MRRISCTVLLSLASLLLLKTPAAQAQKELQSADCSIDGRRLACDRMDFLKRFAEAHTVAFESQPNSRTANTQLASLAQSLGKQVAPALPADIALHLVRIPPTGVAIGPGDMELASLRVFSTKNGAEASRLLWVEIYRGQPDMPWAMVVRALLQQFQATLAEH